MLVFFSGQWRLWAWSPVWGGVIFFLCLYSLTFPVDTPPSWNNLSPFFGGLSSPSARVKRKDLSGSVAVRQRPRRRVRLNPSPKVLPKAEKGMTRPLAKSAIQCVPKFKLENLSWDGPLWLINVCSEVLNDNANDGSYFLDLGCLKNNPCDTMGCARLMRRSSRGWKCDASVV